MKTKFGPRRYRLYPELARFASDEDRAAAFEAFSQGLTHRRSFRLLFLLSVLFVSGVGREAREAIERVMPTEFAVFLDHPLGGWFRLALMCICGLLGVEYLWYRPRRQHLRRWLADRGVPICLRCGYDLSGQVEPRCPECGEPCDSRLIPGSRPAQTSPCSSGSGKESG